MRLADLVGNKYLAPLFFLPSLLYGSVIRCRNRAYRKGLFSSYRSSAFVISIGNIVAGGSGKTPFTDLIVKEFLKTGKTAILSGGYRSQVSRKNGPVIVDDRFSASFYGDEPYLLHRRNPTVPVIVGKERTASAKMAEALGMECLVLDDGMQHRKLYRDVNIVLIDGKDPFGGEALLPLGFLREPLKELKRADLIVINHASEKSDVLEKTLSRYTEAPCLYVRLRKERIYDFLTNQEVSFEGEKIAAFCGIAKPDYFFRQLEREGGEIVWSEKREDHAPVGITDLHRMMRKAREKGASLLVCTEKDAVKIPEGFQGLLPLVVFSVSSEVIRGKEILEKVLSFPRVKSVKP